MARNRRERQERDDDNQYGGYHHGRGVEGYGQQALVPNNGVNNMLAAHLRPQGNELQMMLDQVGEAGEVNQNYQYREQAREEGWWINPLTGLSRAIGNRITDANNAKGQMKALELNHAAATQRVEVARDLTIKTIEANTTKGLKAAELYDNEQKRSHKETMKEMDAAMKREERTHTLALEESKQNHERSMEVQKADLADRNGERAANRDLGLMREKARLEIETMQVQAALMRGQAGRARQAAPEDGQRARGPGFFNERRRDADDEAQQAQGYDNN